MQEFRIGDVISRAFSILFKNFVPFMILTGIVYSPIIVATLLVAGRAQAGTLGEQGMMAFAFGGGLASFVLNMVASAAVMYGVIQQLRGDHASMGACISAGLRRLLPVIGVSILMAICITLGMFLLIIPGIVLMLMFYVAVPATVIEHLGPIDALKRSKELTDGYKVSLFGLVIVLVLVTIGIGICVGLVQAMMPESVGMVINLGFDVFTGALGAVVTAVVYHDLRVIKDGVSVDDLVRVFE